MARRAFWVSLSIGFALNAFVANASALTQPGGGPLIPRLLTDAPNGCDVTSGTGTNNAWGNVQQCLDDHEASLGGTRGALNAQTHAHVDQETFEPQCQLRFKVVQRGGDYRTVFGWYPAVPEGSTTRPPLTDLHVMLAGCDGPDGRIIAPIAGYPDCTAGPSEATLQVPVGTGRIGFFIAHQTWNYPFPLNPDSVPGSRCTPAIGPSADECSV